MKIFNCSAQVTLTRANNAYIVGETFTVHKADTAINVDIVRGNTTWNFSKLLPLDTVTWQTETTTDSAGIISGRDNITLFSNTGKTEYYSYSDTDGIVVNKTLHYEWDGNNEIAKYPLNYNYYENVPLPYPSAIPFGYYKYEGRDTVILSHQTYINVVRVKYYREFKFPSADCSPKQYQLFISACYLWFVPNVNYPIVIAENDINRAFCTNELRSFSFHYQSNITPRAVPIDTTTKAIQPIPLPEVTDVLNLYPNPVTHTLNVYAPIATQFVIYNIVNQLIQVNTTTAAITTINTSNLASGVYIVKTNTGQVAKFIKE
jgi:hypothetical protein